MKYVFSMTLALALLVSASAFAKGGGQNGAEIDVMTQNQYLGADLTPIITAPDPISFNASLVAALEDIAANDYPARAQKLAEIIADRGPALVGLQEMFWFECYDLDPRDGDQCETPSIANAFNNHLQRTLDDLAELDAPYVDVASVNNLDLTTPILTGLPPGLPVDLDFDGALDITVTVLDRDVILVHADHAGNAAPVDYTQFQPFGICLKPSADGCNYQFVASADAPAPVGTIPIERGFVAVDVSIDGRVYRFLDTHLEVQRPDPNPLSGVFQAAQSAELIATLAATTPEEVTLIVVGDINSSPEDPFIPGPLPLPPPFDQGIVPPYTQLVAAGYTDAWTLRPGNQPGYSCCQLDDLSNQQSIHDERIDVIFSREAPSKVKQARVLGSNVSDKTSPPGQGLWSSDHGSVAAELQF